MLLAQRVHRDFLAFEFVATVRKARKRAKRNFLWRGKWETFVRAAAKRVSDVGIRHVKTNFHRVLQTIAFSAIIESCVSCADLRMKVNCD